jgi:hypothetical protein
MPQTCTICRNEKREEIDRALVDGESFRNIARRTATSPTALCRHKAHHIPKRLVLARETAEEVQAGTLFERLRAVNRETLEILCESRGAKNHVVALQAIGRIERQIELEARLIGELDDSVRIAIGLQVADRTGGDGFERSIEELSVEELMAEREILEDAQRRIAASRKPKLIEVGPGAVEEVRCDQTAM